MQLTQRLKGAVRGEPLAAGRSGAPLAQDRCLRNLPTIPKGWSASDILRLSAGLRPAESAARSSLRLPLTAARTRP